VNRRAEISREAVMIVGRGERSALGREDEEVWKKGV
jgi:hypothetical protein